MASRIVRTAAVAWLALTLGCQRYPTASSPDSLRLLASLRAACNNRSAERVRHVSLAVDYTAERGRMTPEEVKAFNKILNIARGGDYKTAEAECMTFQRGQVKTFNW